MNLKKYKSQGKAVEMTVNSEEENFVRILSENSASGNETANKDCFKQIS